ncbi:2-desacetyl-2-hydroxyethyl bacteriochlorophyllide A dehydrogenase [Actinopolymorpha singaporensis]|uniref:2-desacetyl-2-hydroxyethyl bacteriochlorophyllide A dehydrogenase n=1 Tax=Actinopolymorpha singaporensis TaxID=117157 RepID=A0A1H1UPB4_9ACTN|nr:2-desacetyl-2-hydroxyethyl bacteriochlorophyllide A dehydrogenase [Actinopolymorpha singaporensis]
MSSSDAIVCRQPGNIECAKLGLAAVGPRQVVVRTLMSAVSTGTDKWVMRGTFGSGNVSFPAVPGYQRVGIVEEIGSEVAGLRIGQRVVATSGLGYVDVSSSWGAHSSRSISDAVDVYDAEGLPAERSAFVVVAQVGYNAASRLLLPAGAHVLVVGDGVIGASAAFACRARGFDVLLVGRHRSRLEVLGRAGFETLNGRATDPEPTLAEFAPEAVIDTVQNTEAFDMYIPRLPRRTGQVVYSGHSPGGVTAWGDMAVLQERELTVHFVSGITGDRVRATLALMRNGQMPSEQLLGTVAQGPDDARALMKNVSEGRLEPVAAAIDWTWAA